MEELSQVNKYGEWAWELVLEYAPSVALALITLIIGLWVVGMFTRSVRNVMNKRNVDPSLTPFITSLLSNILKVLLVLSILSMVGVQVTSFIAILGAAGLAVGLALQGTLQNFAGGVMILIFKPFKVGDYVEAAGYAGVIKEIQIFVTIMTTPDNKTIIIPNGTMSSSSMINYSKEPNRRVDFTVGVGYGDSIDATREVLLKIASADDRIMKDPEPFVGLSELADSSVNFTFRVWVKGEDYWPVFFETNERIKKELDAAGISIPFPQREITMVNQ